jgi:hypothetical protein
MGTSILSILVFLISALPVFAQGTPTTTYTAQPPEHVSPAVQTPEPTKLVLKEGTDVRLKFAQDLTSKTAVEDDPVNLVLDEDLKVGDITIAKAGAKALGIVTNSKKAGMMG